MLISYGIAAIAVTGVAMVTVTLIMRVVVMEIAMPAKRVFGVEMDLSSNPKGTHAEYCEIFSMRNISLCEVLRIAKYFGM